jgi:transposase
MAKSKNDLELIKQQRRIFTSEFKSKVALEAVSGQLTINEIAEKFDLNRNQVSEWKNKLIAKAHLAFENEDKLIDINKK